MGKVVDLFSKRQNRQAINCPDLHHYDRMPHNLKMQIWMILEEALTSYRGEVTPDWTKNEPIEAVFKHVNKTLCREYGMERLVDEYFEKDQDYIKAFFTKESTPIDRLLDVVELSFKCILDGVRVPSFSTEGIHRFDHKKAIDELNIRFKESQVGYQFEQGQVIRIDSSHMHNEVVAPVIRLLHDSEFDGADEEFRNSYEHYRHSRYKECLVSALNAFESTMKIICERKEWSFDPKKSTSKNLISTCLKEGLIPDYLQTQFSGVQQVLESGVSTMRNKNAGHGQGSTPVQVPDYFARYVLNLTATSILFLLEAYRAKQ